MLNLKFHLIALATLFVVCHGMSSRYFVPAAQPGCGYKSCPQLDENARTIVHMVPHSHDDVGWLKTVDEYYYGDRMGIQRAGIQYILDSVVKELAMDPTKRFIQVETAFFWRWWSDQNDKMKEMVTALVAEGRFEFIGGGWSMHDEATVHYSSLIDNMSMGFKMLLDTFGQCAVPHVAWQIDPFGHSKENARLFALMGFDGLFFARADYREKLQRRENKTLQMIWQTDGIPHTGNVTTLFTGMFANHYEAPEGFCFDIICINEPVIDNPQIQGYNVEEQVDAFLAMIEADAAVFEGPSNKHIMFTMGGDFQYQNARQNFKNMDKLIKHVNARSLETGVVAIYSTPSCYVQALNNEQDNQPEYSWPTKQDDFFPYASSNHSYWTGYFTSRPSLKLMERQHNAMLQVGKQIQTLLSGIKTKIYANQTELNILKRAMGTMQHHDAVTGTEKQAVAEDYAQRMSEGARAVMSFVGPSLFSEAGQTPPLGFSDFLCPLANMSQCHLTEDTSKNKIMMIYNPLARPVSKILRFPVNNEHVEIFNEDGEPLNVNLIPVPEEVRMIPGRNSSAVYDAVFLVSDILPLGYRTFYVKQNGDAKAAKLAKMEVRTGKTDVDLPVDVDIISYSSCGQEPQASGAYIFRPQTENKSGLAIVNVTTFTADLVKETWVSLNASWASYIIREHVGEPGFEVEWLVGPLPEEGAGTEVVMVYSTETTTSDDEQTEFWTDANGRQMVRRLKDHRFSYDLVENIEPVSANYYPITSGIMTKTSDGKTLTVLTDRSQGGTSLQSNQLELMVHRRLFKDDHFGVGEALNEMAFGQPLVARGKHYVHLDQDTSSASQWRRTKAQELYMPTMVMFQRTDHTLDEWLSLDTGDKELSLINVGQLPDNVHLMTVERWDHDEPDQKIVLVRFEHMFDQNEHPTLSNPVSFTIQPNFFVGHTIEEIIDLTLGGNRPLGDLHDRFQWGNHVEEFVPGPTVRTKEGFQFNLQPMQISTVSMLLRMNV